MKTTSVRARLKSSNQIGLVVANIQRAAQKGIDQAALAAEQTWKENIQSGTEEMSRDSGAAVASIYHVTSKSNSSSEARTSFRALYGKSGKGNDPALKKGQSLSEHGQERTFDDELNVESTRWIKRSGVASWSMYLAWWEEGHFNMYVANREAAKATKQADESDDFDDEGSSTGFAPGGVDFAALFARSERSGQLGANSSGFVRAAYLEITRNRMQSILRQLVVREMNLPKPKGG
jgi:hypothetical protein